MMLHTNAQTSTARMMRTAPRRALATRERAWAKCLAHRLARAGVRPNTVSLLSVVSALLAAGAFTSVAGAEGRSRAALLAVAAACVQLRLLCNLLDGMLAIEERSWVPASAGTVNQIGQIYNELPDRLADIVILVGAGYGLRSLPYGVTLGWAAAVLALLTAYVRVLAGSLGLPQSFIGPMAKQHRMFTLTVATLLSIPEALAGRAPGALRAALLVIVVGSIVTVVRRTRRLLMEVSLP
jgi:phosphatidylglycerophosphate synthase